MTVREVMAMLATMEPDAEVVFADTYTQSEGWGDGYEEAVMTVCDVTVREDGSVELVGE